MGSPAWFPQEMQSSTPQTSVTSSSTAGLSSDPLPMTAIPPPIARTSSNNGMSPSIDSSRDIAQQKATGPPGYGVTRLPMSYVNVVALSGNFQWLSLIQEVLNWEDFKTITLCV